MFSLTFVNFIAFAHIHSQCLICMFLLLCIHSILLNVLRRTPRWTGQWPMRLSCWKLKFIRSFVHSFIHSFIHSLKPQSLRTPNMTIVWQLLRYVIHNARVSGSSLSLLQIQLSKHWSPSTGRSSTGRSNQIVEKLAEIWNTLSVN